MFYSFMTCVAFLVLARCLFSESLGEKAHHNSQSAAVGKKGADSSKCSAKGSLCDSVQKLSSINDFLLTMARQYPQTAKLNVIGRTYKYRPIYSMEILHEVDHSDVTTVVVEFGMHGREWASQASAVYTIRRLLEGGKNHTKSIRWFILPVMNPDGYAHSITEDNMWKKNLRRLNKKKCVGVDLNRNFDVGWDLNSEDDLCQDDSPGPRPFSELESKALKKFIESLGTFAVDVYVSVHSCGQAILYPYGYSTKPLSKWKLGRLFEAGLVMAKAMKQLRNRHYDVDVAFKFGGLRGTSADYMFDHFDIPYVYSLELGDRSYFEEYDFHHCYHPPSMVQMKYLTKECYAGLVALADYVSATKSTKIQKLQVPRMRFSSSPSNTHSIVFLIVVIRLIIYLE